MEVGRFCFTISPTLRVWDCWRYHEGLIPFGRLLALPQSVYRAELHAIMVAGEMQQGVGVVVTDCKGAAGYSGPQTSSRHQKAPGKAFPD
eukprot:1998608-Amphidinium_carterae.1